MARTTVQEAASRSIRSEGLSLLAAGQHFDLRGCTEIFIVSIGKAAATMFDAVTPLLPQALPCQAVVSAPEAPRLLRGGDQFFAGGHPLPNQASFEAARAALDLLHSATESTFVLFLISGGASTMFELPLDLGVTLADVLELNRQLIASGAPIRDINCIRKHLSAVKGGKLAAAAPHSTRLSLLISDVPDGALDALGSGPTLPDSTSAAQCNALIARFLNIEALPVAIQQVISKGIIETPKNSDESLQGSSAAVLLNNAALLKAAAASAKALGFVTFIDNSCDDWDYRDAATYLCSRLGELRAQSGKVCLLSGGEVTVRLPRDPGTGGRNQQFALQCARWLRERGEVATILSAGSDGIDGTSPAAGAIADETTWQRASDAGLDVEQHLRGFNAFPLFQTLGDAILTGPSGNNLRDLRLLLADSQK